MQTCVYIRGKQIFLMFFGGDRRLMDFDQIWEKVLNDLLRFCVREAIVIKTKSATVEEAGILQYIYRVPLKTV